MADGSLSGPAQDFDMRKSKVRYNRAAQAAQEAKEYSTRLLARVAEIVD
jgi:hypothetical protein